MSTPEDITTDDTAAVRVAAIDLLDPQQVRDATRGFAADLRSRLLDRVTEMRKERAERLGDLPLKSSDVAPIIRRATGVAEVFEHVGKTLTELGKEARAIAVEEMQEVPGDFDPETRVRKVRRSITIGDGDSEIVVRVPSTSETVVNLDTLADAMVAAFRYTAARELIDAYPQDDERARIVDVAGGAYRTAIDDLLRVLSSPKAKSTEIGALVRTWQSQGDDDIAGLFESAIGKTWTDGKPVVERQDPKRARRV